MKQKAFRTFLGLGLLIVMGVFSLPASAAPPLPGAIFTTDSTCAGVNLNIYSSKDAVYISGGPAHPGAAGLTDGFYYVQVTEPDGTLLGTSIGSGNVTPVQVFGGEFVDCYQLSAILIKASDATPGFDTTTNPGGEYKVWVSNEASFQNSSTKTDNFKVNAEPPPLSRISGTKFYDANLNGNQDSGELGIDAWQVTIFGGPEGFAGYTTNTNTSGFYEFLNLQPGTYGVCEVIPAASPIWVATTPTAIAGITVPPDSIGHDFGNVCLGGGGGLTLGFWSNKNGQRVLTGSNTGSTISSTYVALLNGLNLRTANGNNFDLAASNNYAAFRNWLLSATATNMAYMLSAQLAAMELNVASGGVTGTAMVFAGSAPAGCSVPGLTTLGFISINDLMADANTELGTDGYTPSGNPERACQEFKKNALDSANNNKNFVQATACEVNYSASEPSCVPAQ